MNKLLRGIKKSVQEVQRFDVHYLHVFYSECYFLKSEDRLVIAAFVLGVHIRDDMDVSELTNHSPREIAEIANHKLLKDRYSDVQIKDVVEVFQRLLRFLD